ncbi:hypothetical protein EB796_002601 [Bugula neritina]|uniref:Uncharacterized protein n=1 Tax=Bugula neritina TaxID=10212 RepID=A0A7J7KK56_BUGNE|nr:hypothetical protein EB796_002601 [Bugula neritina]
MSRCYKHHFSNWKYNHSTHVRSSIMRKRLWIYLFRNKLKVFTIIWILILSVNIYQQRKSQSTYIELDNAAEKSRHYKQSQLPETKTEPLRIKSANKEANSFQPFSPYDKPLDNSVYEHIPESFRTNHSTVKSITYSFSTTIRKEGPGFTLITMFNLFTGQAIEGYDKESLQNQINRNWEYLSTIKENINHEQIKRVVLLYADDNSIKVLYQQNWVNNSKIFPMKMPRLIHMSDFFNISSIHLLDEPVIAANGDILIGENFDQIDTIRLRDTKTLYTLTRHGNRGIGDCVAQSMCLMKYYGSHDTHIFRLKSPVPATALQHLNYPVNLQQAENGMIGILKTELKFTVYNPCPILKTYHIHCSQIAKRLKKGHNSIRDSPWNIRIIKTSRPIYSLKYGL